MSQDLKIIMEIYNDLTNAVADAEQILRSAIKYVPVNTKEGIDLRTEYNQLLSLLNKITYKKY